MRLIACATPTNLAEQVVRLAAGLAAGSARAPRFDLTAAHLPEVVARLRRADDALAARDELAALYAARAGELALEAEMCGAVGTARLAVLARRRYALGDELARAAETVARQWIDDAEPPSAPAITIRSDDEQDPGSLLCRMRREIGRRRLPVRVVPAAGLSALAATGPGEVYISRGAMVSPRTVARVVLHEIEGHVMPRLRAAAEPLGIFALGTARGSDAQEGRALWIEQQAGMLSAGRRRELARRHLAALALRRGADVVQTARLLMTTTGASTLSAARIACRVHRGGGLGRELVYLPSLLRVREAWERSPELEGVLRRGQVSVAAAPLLDRWCAARA